MRRCILIKDYNRAYEPWLRAYLRDKRIMGDREYSLREAQDISMDMDRRGVKDEFFQYYFWAWREHPEHPPDYYSLLRIVLPLYKGDKLDFAEISKLDKEARERGQRILFTVEDAAKDFHDFYEKFLMKPLARDLERGTEGRKLSNYFEFEEFDKIPDIRIHGREKVEEADRVVAVELLERLRAITVEKILNDINQTLDQHYEKGVAAASPQSGYNYKSEYIQLSMHRETGPKKPVTTFLRPARSYAVIKEGYQGVYYPRYYVEPTPE